MPELRQKLERLSAEHPGMHKFLSNLLQFGYTFEGFNRQHAENLGAIRAEFPGHIEPGGPEGRMLVASSKLEDAINRFLASRK